MRIVFFDDLGRLRSGWRVVFFLFLNAVLLGFTWLAADEAARRWGNDDDAADIISPASLIGITVGSMFALAAALVAGYVSARFLEGLPFRSLGAWFTKGWLRDLALGCGMGVAAFVFALLPALASGGLRFSVSEAGMSAVLAALVPLFVMFALAAAFEEAFFRGYMFQTLMRSGLAWLAVALTAAFFGIVHTGNPNAGVISTLNTTLAGVWFAAAYLKTRTLWFVFGMHLAWNFVQGPIFGVEVSGLGDLAKTSLLVESDTGPQWLTGGDYGIEAGIGCTLALVASTAVIWRAKWLRADPEMLALTSEPSRDIDLKADIDRTS